MPIYYGRSADGSDSRIFEGVYHNEVTGQWSNDKTQIFTKEQLADMRRYEEVIKHISGKRSFKDEYELILQKKSTLTKSQRDWLVDQIENSEKENDNENTTHK